MKYIKIYLLIAIFLPAYGWCDRGQNWSNDIDSFYNGLVSNHINPFSKISEQEFLDEISILKRDVESISDTKIIVELMKIARKIGDGHTAVHFHNDTDLKTFPIELYDDSGTWRVIGIAEENKNILGAQFTHIGKYNIEELKKTLSKVVQFVENENSLQQRISQYIRYSELLFELGLIDSEEISTFTFLKGQEKIEIELQSTSSDMELLRYQVYKPKLEKIKGAGIDALWYGMVLNSNAIYVKFGQYPSFEQMDKFGQNLLNYINENNVRQLILDLRGNWGGDFYVGVWLAYYLNLADSIDWLNGVYTLVDKDTFSAATINATQFKQLLNAKIVGEPTGSNPNGVQDMGTFELPHSGLMISYSKRVFRLQGKPNEPLIPDVKVKYSWESYIAGEDNILEWVLNDVKKSEANAEANKGFHRTSR
ncbi:S41 family peptidase [Colwellia sp. E2M01]|uniref:S41 family peptidase n=1 Tax=Colwellia sp. E2M01 TaxID=2841561 RepID=UPI001C09546E|nr:S41 family peptidase [Colwellia sp. E2M01]MBU2870559.1 hypothetical protein [Colwellia sp. E2M01]